MASSPAAKADPARLAHLSSVGLLAFDLLAGLLITSLWLGSLEVHSVPKAALLCVALFVARVLAWRAHSRRSMASITELIQHQENTTDRQLVAAIEVLRRLPLRHAWVYTSSWVAYVAVGTALFWLLPDGPVTVGRGELLVLALLALGATMGAPGPLALLASTRLEPMQIILHERLGLDTVPPQTAASSLSHHLLKYSTFMVLGPVFVVLALAWRAELGAARGAATHETYAEAVEQSHALERGAPRPANQELLTGPQLPPELGWTRDARRRTLVHLDTRRDRVTVASPTAAGHWLVLSQSVDLWRGGLWPVLAVALATIVSWGMFSAWMLAGSVSSPVRGLREALERLVEVGDLEAMATIPVLSGDDLGTLARDFNALLANLRSLAEAAQSVAQGQLGAEIDGQGQLTDALRGVVVQIHDTMAQVRETASGLAVAASEIQAATRTQERANEQQSMSVSEISETTKSLASSAAQISKAVGRVFDNAESTLAATDELSSSITELAARSAGIGELAEIISDVADRSDLLALNGALEATRVGEAGLGFALVAAEMRRLAERVTGTVRDVRQLVIDITDRSESSVDLTELGRALAEGTTNAAREIADQTRHQTTYTQYVSRGVGELAEFVSQTKAATSQTRATAEELQRKAEELEQVTLTFGLGINDSSST